MLARQWQQRQAQQRLAIDLNGPDNVRHLVSTLAHAGLYSLTRPGEAAHLSAFADLRLIYGGMAFRNSHTGQENSFDFAAVQWVSTVQLSQEGVAAITVHFEIHHQWWLLHLQLAEAEMGLIVKLLRRTVPASRMNIGHRTMPPIGPIEARIASETLQGETTLGADVGLYLLPHMLVVLQADTVRAKLDMSSVRRVLAVERVPGRLSGILHPGTAEGIVRLYSLYETVSFALPQYRELAEEISTLSRCPVEFIMKEDKTQKL